MPLNQKVSSEPVLVKTYKDGSKRWRVDACPRCNGKGYLSGFGHVYNGICFKCNGSGYAPHEYTEKSEDRLERERAMNQAKLIAQSDERNAKFYKNNGFNENGKTYVVLGNTYAIKDELKELGAKFDYIMGWKLPEDNEAYDTIEVDINEVATFNDNGWLIFKDSDEINSIIEKKKKEFENAHRNPDDKISEYVGNVGDKITVDVTIKRIADFETHFTYRGETQWIYKFEDDDGNIYLWKTASGLDKKVGNHLEPMVEGESCKITGTIKDHKEYKGEKETILTRVKKL